MINGTKNKYLKAYVMSFLGMTKDEAEWYIKKYRPFAILNYWHYRAGEEERSKREEEIC